MTDTFLPFEARLGLTEREPFVISGDTIVVPKKWTNNTGGYYNNITVQFVMEVS